ncbi:MAG: pimeloyl-ACP methyl ester carboxylesterase [Polyangiales bacterium]|jgi:pimeloyl-ACP methyl ester carboxylesterase
MRKSVDLQVASLAIHTLQEGDPSLPALLCLHGWPTNAELYRHLMPVLAPHRRVIAVDLPGFGESEEPPGRYSFRFFDAFLNELVDVLGVPEVGLMVHDLGGPIGLHWAVHNPSRVRELIVLNTLAYPNFSWAVALFAVGLKLPVTNRLLTSPQGVEAAIRLGVRNKARITPDVARLYSALYKDRERQHLLRRSGMELSLSGFKRIAAGLSKLDDKPSALVYGDEDRILPDVAKTMRRLHNTWPLSTLTALSAGHFIQEDVPVELGAALLNFVAD